MARSSKTQPMPLFKAALMASISLVALWEAPPLEVAGYDVIELAAYAGLMASGPSLISKALLMGADALDDIAASIPRGMKGTAAWASSIKELSRHLVKPGLFKTGHAPYWGCLKRGLFGFGRQSLHADITAVGVCVGASGSGKDISVNLPNVLATPGSKVILDFDGSTTCIMANALRRQGETVHILNFDDTFAEILGESDQYNPLHVIADNFERPGGILDVSSDCTQYAHALYPEPQKEGEGANKFFRDGSRGLIKFGQQVCVLIDGREASMADVLALIQDKEQLLQHALWAAGRLEQDDPDSPHAKIPIEASHWAGLQDLRDIQSYADNLAKMGSALADLILASDSRTFDSFQTGAINELEDLNTATRVSKKIQASTFRFSDLKEKDATVFLVMDNSRIEAQAKVFTLIADAMLKELTRHPNKKKPVTLFMNEINNYTFKGLVSLFSWCRKYNIRLFLFLQSLSAFRKKNGEDALNALISESDIKLYLPEGQRDPLTLEQLEKDLGQASHMVVNKSARASNAEDRAAKIDQQNYAEEGRALMNRDELRRLKGRGILFLRNERPVRVYLPSIASMWPFRGRQGINPFYNKPYLLPVSLRLMRYAPFMPAVMLQTAKRRLRQRKSAPLDAGKGGRR